MITIILPDWLAVLVIVLVGLGLVNEILKLYLVWLKRALMKQGILPDK